MQLCALVVVSWTWETKYCLERIFLWGVFKSLGAIMCSKTRKPNMHRRLRWVELGSKDADCRGATYDAHMERYVLVSIPVDMA